MTSPPQPPVDPTWPPAGPQATVPTGSGQSSGAPQPSGAEPGIAPAGGHPPASGSYPPFGQPPDVTGESSGADRIAFVIVAALVGVALGFAGGWVWAKLADPPQLLVTKDGAFLTGELSYDAQVVVTLWFLAVGVVGGLVPGLVVGLLGRRHGAATVVAAVAMAAVASGLSAWLGIHVFGPDATSALADASPGDLITAKLTIGTDVAYLGWPIGALIGALTGIALWPREPKRPPDGALSGTVIGPPTHPRGM